MYLALFMYLLAPQNDITKNDITKNDITKNDITQSETAKTATSAEISGVEATHTAKNILASTRDRIDAK